MIIRGFSKLDLRDENVIECLIKSIKRFIIDAGSYPLKHLTFEYMQKRKPIRLLSPSQQSESIHPSTEACSSSSAYCFATPLDLVWILEACAQFNVNNQEVSDRKKKRIKIHKKRNVFITLMPIFY